MTISRRALMKAALGVGAALAAGVAGVAAAGPGVNGQVAAGAGGSAKYQPGPGDPGLRGPGDMIMAHDGEWHTHLLPFAKSRAGMAAVVADLKLARAQGLLA